MKDSAGDGKLFRWQRPMFLYLFVVFVIDFSSDNLWEEINGTERDPWSSGRFGKGVYSWLEPQFLIGLDLHGENTTPVVKYEDTV